MRIVIAEELVKTTKMDEDDLPEFGALPYTQQDYISWRHINKISKYLQRSSIGSLAETKALMDLRDESGLYPFHLAVKSNDTDAVLSFLTLGDSIDRPDGSGRTPIFYAVAAGNQPMINLLLNHGAQAEIRDNDGDNLLHIAASTCQHKVLEYLLDNTDLELDSRDKYQWTPLHMAAWGGCREAAEVLLFQGAQVDPRGDTNLTPLILAIGRNHMDVAELLVHRGADTNAKPTNGWSPLHRAAASGYADAVKLLLYHGADMYQEDRMGRTPMQLAIARNNVDVIQLFTTNGYMLSKKDYTLHNGDIPFL